MNLRLTLYFIRFVMALGVSLAVGAKHGAAEGLLAYAILMLLIDIANGVDK